MIPKKINIDWTMFYLAFASGDINNDRDVVTRLHKQVGDTV